MRVESVVKSFVPCDLRAGNKSDWFNFFYQPIHVVQYPRSCIALPYMSIQYAISHTRHRVYDPLHKNRPAVSAKNIRDLTIINYQVCEKGTFRFMFRISNCLSLLKYEMWQDTKISLYLKSKKVSYTLSKNEYLCSAVQNQNVFPTLYRKWIVGSGPFLG